jgi:hypothetical protein
MSTNTDAERKKIKKKKKKHLGKVALTCNKITQVHYAERARSKTKM